MLCKYGCGKEANTQLKDGTWICGPSVNTCPILRKKNSDKLKVVHNVSAANQKANKTFKKCCFCNKNFTIANIGHHEKTCYLNPKNIKYCIDCGKAVEGPLNKRCNNCVKTGKGNSIHDNSVQICFKYHLKKCAICPEENIVAVHHYNGDHFDNKPENLVPLCPTHHVYCHSRFYNLIESQVSSYVNAFIQKQAVAQSGSAPLLGSGGREFESPSPDQHISILKLCECGCGKEVTYNKNRFLIGHNTSVRNKNILGDTDIL